MSTPDDAAKNIFLREATAEDQQAMLALLPQLADFDIPPRRKSEELWAGDADLLRELLAGLRPNSFADVAQDQDGNIAGLIIVTMREEMLSHAPSAHLEAIVVSPHMRGIGLGRRLLSHCEQRAKAQGAGSLTLHVFNRNQRARSLYQSHGFDLEMTRAIRWLDEAPTVDQ